MSVVFSCEDIRQFYYCPRIIYFRYVLRARVQQTFKMVRGSEVHRKVSIDADRRNIYLISESLGLCGIVDAIRVNDDGSVDVIEIKTGDLRRRMSDSHKAQLAAQAMLIEEVLGLRIRRIIVFNPETKQSLEINISSYHRDMVVRALDEMRRIVVEELIPSATRGSRCVDCEYRVYCDDV